MYYVEKRFEISGSHSLDLPYPSKCKAVHGHNWVITVYCRARELNNQGMVTDFSRIKSEIADVIDHTHFNDVLPFNPTAENIARWIQEKIENCYRVEVKESDGNMAAYEID